MRNRVWTLIAIAAVVVAFVCAINSDRGIAYVVATFVVVGILVFVFGALTYRSDQWQDGDIK